MISYDYDLSYNYMIYNMIYNMLFFFVVTLYKQSSETHPATETQAADVWKPACSIGHNLSKQIKCTQKKRSLEMFT